jgi:hypothetical protein
MTCRQIQSGRLFEPRRRHYSLVDQLALSLSTWARSSGHRSRRAASQAPSPIRAYYRKLVKQLVYGALTD